MTTENPMVADMSEGELLQIRVEYLLMHIVRHRGTFDLAYDQLDPDMFSKPSEMPYRHIWRCTKEYYDKHGELPNYEALSVAALEAVGEDPITCMDDKVGQGLIDATLDILTWIFDPERLDQITPSAARDILQDILISRGPEHEIRRAIQASSGKSIRNLPAIVSKMQRRIEDIQSLGAVEESVSIVPETWDQIVVPKMATGVEWVDRIMEGGGEPGNCNVIIGPTGGGKTTTAMQLAVSTARLQHQIATRRKEGEPGSVVFVSYEDDLRMLQIRANSYGAEVLKNRLRDKKPGEQLSTVGNLEPYEQAMYANDGTSASEQLGECERLEQAKPWLSKYLHPVDHHDPAKGGRGGIPEVKAKLTALQDKTGMPIKMVVLDWAGNLVSNQLQGQDGSVDGSKMSLHLQNLVNIAKHELAAPFGCTVWIPHQLTGRVNKLSPAYFPHHSDSQWCSTFADHAWYAFVLGTKDKEHSVCQFGATKTRHGETPAPVILKIDGAFCRMVDVSQHFQIDKITGRLSPATDANKFYEPGPEDNQEPGTDVNSR